MTYVETFATREERNSRARDLRSRGHHVHKTTDQVDSGKVDKKGRKLGEMVYEVRWSEHKP
jgi:hypothetical protein